jgi:hypothetical protein
MPKTNSRKEELVFIPARRPRQDIKTMVKEPRHENCEHERDGQVHEDLELSHLAELDAVERRRDDPDGEADFHAHD